MSKRILILHGWGGSDYPHWQSWLAGEVAKEYGCVNFLKFSNFDAPQLDVWMDELKTALKDFRPQIVLCHSLANSLWFHLCNCGEIAPKIEKLFLIAPPSNSCDIPQLSEFFPLELPNNLFAEEIMLVASDNDPYITLQEIQKMQQELKCSMKILPGGGHINSDSNYGEWPWIKEELKRLCAF